MFVVLVLWIASLLLESCALGPLSRWLGACPPVAAGVTGDLAAEMEHTGHLEDRVRQLERQLALLRDCPLAPAAVEEPQPAALPDTVLAAPQTEQPSAAPSEPSAPDDTGETEQSPAPAELPREEPRDDPHPEPPASTSEPPVPEDIGETQQTAELPPSEFDERVEEQQGEISEELTVTLIWNDQSDLDLEVHCPGGGAVGIVARGCPGGLLDVDANGYGSGGLRMMTRPVENVRFQGEAENGEYWVRIFIVENYEREGGHDRRRNFGRHPFQVRVISRGEVMMFEDVHDGLGRGDVWLSFVHD